MFKQCCLIVFLIIILIKPVRSERYLKVVTNCNDVVILLDTTHIRQAALLKVNSGNYILKCWAPNHEMTIDTIKISGDTTLYFKKKLQYTNKYKVYKKELGIYKGYLFGTSAYVVASVASHFLMSGMMNNAYDKAIVNKTAYENAISPDKLSEYKLAYEKDKDRYEALRISDNTLKIVSVGVIAFGIYETILHKKRLEKIQYHESPVLVNFGFGSYGFNQPMAKIVWKF